MKLSFLKSKYLAFSTIALVLFILLTAPVNAGWMEVVIIPFTWTFVAITYALGAILVVLMYILVWVAQYNDFINAPAVQTGWIIVRDICNMFFILILLVIAFATTLNRESYGMKRLLPKFILAAIFINFSKLICGVIIDFAQVIMLTFVNGFRDIGPGNLTAMLGINDLLDVRRDTPENANLITIFGSYVLALLYTLVAVVVILVILFVLIMRMVMLWIYIVLSPLAYLLMVLPATEKYSKQWWDQFVQNVVSGPILAFFIWLSFAAISITSTGTSIMGDTPKPNQTENETTRITNLNAPSAGLGESGTPDGMVKIIISIGMLMGGLMITKQLGGVAGSIAGSGMDKLKKGALKARDWGKDKSLVAAKAAGRGAVGATGFAMAKTGNVLTKFGEKRPGSKLGRLTSKMGSDIQLGGQFMKDYHQDLSETRAKDKWEKRKKTLEKLGMKDRSMESLEKVAKTGMGKTVGAVMMGANPATGGLYGTAAMGGGMILGGFSKKIKNFALNKEKQKNLKDTDNLLENLERNRTKEKADGHEKLLKERDQKFVNYDENEKLDLEAQQKKNAAQLADAYARNAPRPELNKLRQDHKGALDNISLRYDKLREKAEEDYQGNASSMEVEVDRKYQDRFTKAEAYKNVAEKVIERDEKRKEADDWKKSEYANIDREKNNKINEAKKNLSSSPMARDMEVKRIEEESIRDKSRVDETHQQRINTVNSRYSDIPEVTELRHFGTKALDKTATKVGDINVNKVTIKAAQEGAKERKTERARVEAFAGGDSIFNGSAGDYSGVAENASKHKLLWEFMSANSDTSKAALANIEKELKALRESGDDLKPKQDSIIQKLKQGIARDLIKNPEHRGALDTLISELDKHNTKDGKKTNDYK